jgi:CRISPR system Cascade subunit CasD
MLSDNRFLALCLEGPFQSWGFDSQYNRRNTGLMPTKSAIAGMCCAALGYQRGSEHEQKFLFAFNKVRMTSIAIPRQVDEEDLSVRRLQDYHTVGGGYDPDNPAERHCIAVTAKDRKPKTRDKQTVITYRQYLNDAYFGVLLEGDADLLGKLAAAFADPKWGVWLGRKTCVPSAPVLAGFKGNWDNVLDLVKESREDAIHLLIGEKPLELFTRQVELDNFADGRDTLPDAPVSFATELRLFSPRRVRTIQGRLIR